MKALKLKISFTFSPILGSPSRGTIKFVLTRTNTVAFQQLSKLSIGNDLGLKFWAAFAASPT